MPRSTSTTSTCPAARRRLQQTGKVFVGQRKEPFYIAVGKIFDLINLNPLGAEVGGNNNDLEGKNVSTLALEVPIACLTDGTEPVIGVYTTASLRQGRLLNGFDRRRTCRPATRRARKAAPGRRSRVSACRWSTRWSSASTTRTASTLRRPTDDATNFADYVTNPTLPALIQTLFPSAMAPTNFPRTDLVTAFLTGLPTVNQPAATTNPIGCSATCCA